MGRPVESKLAAPVRVVHEACGRAAVVDRHVQGIENQLGPQVVRHRPADHLSGEGVEHEGQVEPPLLAPGVGYVRNPETVGCSGGEVALHQIGGRRCPLGGVRTGGTNPSPATAATDEARFSHQPRHPFPSAPDAGRAQLGVDPRSPVGLPAVPVYAPNPLRERRVGPIPRRRWPVPPPVVAALGNLEHPAHGAHPVVGLLRIHQGVDHRRGRRFSS